MPAPQLAHALEPNRLIFPGLHLTHPLAGSFKVSINHPEGHPVQNIAPPVAVVVFVESHDEHIVSLEPAVNVSRGHGIQKGEADMLVNFPGAHSTQMTDPVVLAYKPGLHAERLCAPPRHI